MTLRLLLIALLGTAPLCPAFESAIQKDNRRVLPDGRVRTLWRIAVGPKAGEVVISSVRSETVETKTERVVESKEVLQLICNPPAEYAAEVGFTFTPRDGQTVLSDPMDFRIFGLGQDLVLSSVFNIGQGGGSGAPSEVNRRFRFANAPGQASLHFNYRFEMRTISWEKAEAIATAQGMKLSPLEPGKQCSYMLRADEKTAEIFKN